MINFEYEILDGGIEIKCTFVDKNSDIQQEIKYVQKSYSAAHILNELKRITNDMRNDIIEKNRKDSDYIEAAETALKYFKDGLKRKN